MKRTVLTLSLALLAASAMVSCGGDDKGKNAAQPAAQTSKQNASADTGASASQLPNYRVINMDTIALKYNLSIDFNEQYIKMQNNYQEEYKKQNTAMNSKGESFMKRYQEASSQSVPLPSEMDKLQKEYASLQTQAGQIQEKLAKMEVEIEQTQMKNLKTITDSLRNFLKDYAAARGYDAIIESGAVPYYNPALDVTTEVVEGLNARYNKVK